MMRIIYVLVAALLWCAPLAAQSITVRSGEHGTFTRLALDVPIGTQWELTPRPNGMILSLKMDGVFLDTSKVFSRISKTRIREIQARGPVLDLLLACNCKVSAFLEQDKMLVVDISDPIEAVTVAPEPSFTTTLAEDVTEIPPQIPNIGFGYGELLWLDQERTQARERPPISSVEPVETMLGTSQSPDRSNLDSPRSKYVRQAEAELLMGIGKAATRGLIEPNLKIVKKNKEHAESESLETHDAMAVTGHEVFGRRENLRVRNGMFETQHASNEPGTTEEGFVCPDPKILAMQDWGDDSGFAKQIGFWRAKLVAEFDHIDKNAIVGLARTYLYFGFGAEARSVLSLDDEVASQNDLLLLLADILDSGYGEAENMLLPYTGCDSAFALWSLAAHQSLPSSAEVNADAVLLALNHLPVHLREYLGPILSNRLLEHGDAEAASGVLRTVNRALQEPQADVEMAEANLALDRGELQAAQELLESVVEANATMSPVALIALVDAKLSGNEPISAETATLAAAYAHEQRDTELGPDLRRVHVLARSQSNQFDAAFDALDRLRQEDGRSSSHKLRSQVFDLLTKNADDVTFMRFSLLQSQVDISQLDEDVANGMADRLLILGFPDLAAPLIRDPALGSDHRTRRILRARIALASDRPRQAEAEVIGLHGVDIDHLVAQARSMMGDHSAAIKIFDSMRSTDKALRAAWLSENWDRLAESDDPLYAEIAALVEQSLPGENPQTDSEANSGVLAENRRLLGQSAAARSVLSALLEANSTDGTEVR